MSWRTLALLLAALELVTLYRDCTRPSPTTATSSVAATCPEAARSTRAASAEPAHERAAAEAAAAGEATGDASTAAVGLQLGALRLPAWTALFAPQPGEDLHDYKQRMLPLVEAALQPHRDRVAAARDQLVSVAHLDASQRAALDDAAHTAATEIEDKLLGAALAGDFSPSTFKPMAGVAAARDVLDIVDRANRQFVAKLTDEQRAQLAQQPFDFADYLLFATRWEDALPF